MQPELFDQPDRPHLYTTADMAQAFGRCEMTIYHWRRYKDMPAQLFPSAGAHAVRFLEGPVRRWAEIHGFPIVDESIFSAKKD